MPALWERPGTEREVLRDSHARVIQGEASERENQTRRLPSGTAVKVGRDALLGDGATSDAPHLPYLVDVGSRDGLRGTPLGSGTQSLSAKWATLESVGLGTIRSLFPRRDAAG